MSFFRSSGYSDFRRDILALLPKGVKHRTRGISLQCDGCGRGVLYGHPWNEYVLIYDDKVYGSRHCFHKHFKENHEGEHDFESEIEFNLDFNARHLRVGKNVKGVVDERTEKQKRDTGLVVIDLS